MMTDRFARRVRRLLAPLALLALAGAAAPGASALAQAPLPGAAATAGDRIVSVGGAVTEILYALGLERRIAGVDTTSLFPARALQDKPNVGYVRALSPEGVLSLRPSLVITSEAAGPPDAVKLIQEAGIRIARVPDEPTAEGVIRKIAEVGRLTGAEADAGRLAAAVDRRFAVLAKARASIDRPVKVLFVLALQNGRPLVGGAGTSADSIIRLAGGANAAGTIQGYKPMTDEAVIAAAPEIVVMMTRGDAAPKVEDVFATVGLAATPAGARRALVVMDGLYLLGFGPRTPDAARDLMKAFYPALDPPALPGPADGGARP
ncbi:ABC transporter substrate-binding protein [Chelatococcus sp. SYSU_G07232]|uniref:ABC transporter substrate-binding protein n=1 Tax=Chelatococcus albus TaxID=3047466 RepID=A0ABT7AJP5_9HYPH|nr:ABC transporter substrate-binding protein [Chelatococcus sp. SYSU_G07232]MDJ1159601.1 ABC transporter substrate-binding protein [Chelatococcus sp. SYSU_G07232]